MKSVAKKVVAAARKAQPELWEKIDAVARIVDPAAYSSWTVQGKNAKEITDSMNAKKAYDQSAAEHKAAEILKTLGHDTETDWFTILDLIRKDKSNA